MRFGLQIYSFSWPGAAECRVEQALGGGHDQARAGVPAGTVACRPAVAAGRGAMARKSATAASVSAAWPTPASSTSSSTSPRPTRPT